MVVKLEKARIDLQVDIGFGDVITPRAQEVVYPTLLGMEPPRLRAYPKETVVAEKFEAMVKLGLSNSRMKDFYDLIILARSFAFNGPELLGAIVATFTRRRTAIPIEDPVALSQTFAQDDSKRKQWVAFRKRSELTNKIGELDEVVAELSKFLLPPLRAAANQADFTRVWITDKGWSAK